MILAIWFLCGAGMTDSTVAQSPELPPVWDRWRSFLWMEDGIEAGTELFAGLDATGICGTNVAGKASSEAQGKARRPFYLDHSAGKGTLWLDAEDWAAAQKALISGDRLTGASRPRCLSDPEIRNRAKARIREVVPPAARNGALAFSLDDEISLGRGNCPQDFCFCEACLAGFRSWLAKRYESPAALSRAWGFDIAGFEAAMPLTTQGIRRRELLHESDSANFAPWGDHRRFMEESFERALLDLAEEVRRLAPGRPVGFSGGEAPSPFSGIDWTRIARTFDYFEPYDVGGLHELIRSFIRPGAVLSHTIFRCPLDPRVDQHELLDFFLRGDRGAIIWSSKEWFEDDDPSRPSEWAKSLTPTLKFLASDEAAEFTRAEPERAEIAIYESQASNRIHWLLDSRFDGNNWVHRYGEFLNKNSSQDLTRESWQRLLEDIQFPYEHIDQETLTTARLDRYKVLILPRTIALSEAEAAAIRRFAAEGMVIADCQTGLFDERLAARDAGVLDDLFGINRLDRRVRIDQDRVNGRQGSEVPQLAMAEPGITVKERTTATLTIDGAPCVLVQRRGAKGRACYLNLAVAPYLEQRLSGDDHELRNLVRGLLRVAGVQPSVEIHFPKGVYWPIRVNLRRSGDRTFVGMIPNWRRCGFDESRPGPALLEEGLLSLDVSLRQSGIVRRLDDEAAAETPVKPRRQSWIKMGIAPFEARLYRIDP